MPPYTLVQRFGNMHNKERAEVAIHCICLVKTRALWRTIWSDVLEAFQKRVFCQSTRGRSTSVLQNLSSADLLQCAKCIFFTAWVMDRLEILKRSTIAQLSPPPPVFLACFQFNN